MQRFQIKFTLLFSVKFLLASMPLLAQKYDRNSIAVGEKHTCAIVEDGRVKCWGQNSMGALGTGTSGNLGDHPGEMGANLPFVDLGGESKVVSLAAGFRHSCALFENGRVKCWGRNNIGQLGLGDKADRGKRPEEMGKNLPYLELGTGLKARFIVAGHYHTCVIFEEGRVKCWGENRSGALGLGDEVDRGGSVGQMGDNLPFVDLGEGKKAVALGAGWLHTCALLSGGEVKCWGHSHSGQLGSENKVIVGMAPGQMGDQLKPVNLGNGFKARLLSTGSNFNCAVSGRNKIKCWGFNGFGQLGLGNRQNYGDAPGEMGEGLPYVSLGIDLEVSAIYSSAHHTCPIFENQTTKCWGYNGNGELALGDTEHRGIELSHMGVNLPFAQLGQFIKVDFVASFMRHACARLADQSIKCWGNNDSGQLGLEDTLNRGSTPDKVGDFLPFVNL